MSRSWVLVPCFLLSVFAALSAAAVEPVVAIHVSENTAAAWRYTSWKSFHPNQFLEEALISDGTPFVEVSDAAITAGRLLDGDGAPRFPILFSLAAEAVSDDEADQIAKYVLAGGTVYVGSSSWTRYADGRPRLDSRRRPAFALGTQMGLVARGWILTSTVKKVDEHRMIDHLDRRSYDWTMPGVYNIANLSEPHWIFAALPAATSPARSLLTALRSPYFLRSVFAPPTVDNAASATFRFADVNGDGKADLVYRVGEEVFVRLSTGQGFEPAVRWSTWRADYDFNLADVDGDGKADLIGRSGADVQVGLSNGSRFLASRSWTTWRADYDYQLADVDGDGKADIVGRSGMDVQVGISDGARFLPSKPWTSWRSTYDYQLADVNGDGKADIVGRAGSDIQVGLSDGSHFLPSTGWGKLGSGYALRLGDIDGDGKADAVGRAGFDVVLALSDGKTFKPPRLASYWADGYNFFLADINGDGRADAVGCKITQSADRRVIGDVEIGLSGGLGASTEAELAERPYGAGSFIYNAEIVPLAGYGGFANDNSEYKTVRTAIEQAFAAMHQPLVTLSPWPFPFKAAVIERHDHFLAMDLHDVEQQIIGASPSHPFGEYYIMPELAGLPGACGEPNDYFAFVRAAEDAGAIVGAHVKYHYALDYLDEATAYARILETVNDIQSDTGNLMAHAFVAPTYQAIRPSSMNAIWRAGFLTSGEQGVGPLPHFAFDPENNKKYIGTLLELPTSEWPGYDNIERMSVDLNIIDKAADLAYQLGGLINVYDHSGADYYGVDCPNSRASLEAFLLQHVSTLPRVWPTNSLEIRDWWLQRTRRSLTVTISQPSAASTVIEVVTQKTDPRATTTFPSDGVALKITLDPDSQKLAAAGVSVTLDGRAPAGKTCSDQSDVVMCDGNVILVKTRDSRAVSIRLGAPAS